MKNIILGRDLARDQKSFNCSQEHELDYVSGLYANKIEVYNFLVAACKNNLIKNSTHMQVYQLIKSRLGYEIPVH